MSDEEPRVLVGVDGSAGSREALRWALRYAEKCDGRITALVAWKPLMYVEAAPTLPPIEDDESRARAEQATRRTVDETRTFVDSTVPVRVEAVTGAAASSLLHYAREADLLVVGSRGHGGFVGALLGSVSQHCVTHAPCPVVVVRPHHVERGMRHVSFG